MERILGAEFTAPPRYEKRKDAPTAQTNCRHGMSIKVLKGQRRELSLTIPRDRGSSIEPDQIRRTRPGSDG
jgi:transposase-like protein